MSKDTGGPAFPVNTANIPNAGACFAAEGVTVRDYFAAMAMQAYLGSYENGHLTCPVDVIAADAYDAADAMLAERNKE